MMGTLQETLLLGLDGEWRGLGSSGVGGAQTEPLSKLWDPSEPRFCHLSDGQVTPAVPSRPTELRA